METVTNTGLPRVDVHLGKFSQACVVILTGLAFLFNQPLLVPIAAILMALAACVPAASPFKFLYTARLVAVAFAASAYCRG